MLTVNECILPYVNIILRNNHCIKANPHYSAEDFIFDITLKVLFIL